MAKIWEWGEFWERIREMGRCQIMQGLVNWDRGHGFYLKCYGKPLEGGKQGVNTVQCNLYSEITTLSALWKME